MWCSINFHLTPLTPALESCDTNSLSMEPLNSTSIDKCHMMWTASSMAPLHFWIYAQHNFIGYMLPLVLGSVTHNFYGLINGTITLLRSAMIIMRCNMTFFCHWHQSCHDVMPTVLSMAPLHFLHQDDWNKVQHGLLVMWHYWCWHLHYMMPTALSLPPLHSLGQDDQNEVWHIFLLSDLIMYFTCSLTLLYTQIKNKKKYLYFSSYNHICTNNKYDPQMPQIYHIYQSVHVYIW